MLSPQYRCCLGCKLLAQWSLRAQSYWVLTANAIHEVKLVVSLVLFSSDVLTDCLLLKAAVVDSVLVVREHGVLAQVLWTGRMVCRFGWVTL